MQTLHIWAAAASNSIGCTCKALLQAPVVWTEPNKLTQEQAAAFFHDKGLSESRHAWQAVLISCLAHLAVFSLCHHSRLASRLVVPQKRALHWSQRALKGGEWHRNSFR